MKELGRSVQLVREPTLAESVAIRDAIERALSGLGARVTRLTNTSLQFHIPAPWKSKRLNPLFVVSGGEIDVSAGAGGGRRVRYRLSFVRLRVYAMATILVIALAGLGWARPTVILALLLTWVVVFAVPWLIASQRFRRFVAGTADAVMRAGR